MPGSNKRTVSECVAENNWCPFYSSDTDWGDNCSVQKLDGVFLEKDDFIKTCPLKNGPIIVELKK